MIIKNFTLLNAVKILEAVEAQSKCCDKQASTAGYWPQEADI